jgi:hypothetical protein
MELSGSNGDRFELTILGYQFPYSSKEKHDANWLVIRTEAAIAGRAWSTTDPSLLTWEVEELIGWLENLSRKEAATKLLDFLEPNISFELLDTIPSAVKLKISLQLESQAPWRESIGASEHSEGPQIDCTGQELLAWAADLRDQLRKFPKRAPLPTTSDWITDVH